MIRPFLILCFSLFVVSAHSAEDPDIRQLMTTEELAASGLDELSNEEIEVINRWLTRYTALDADDIRETSPAVQEIENADIRSQIDGEFNGWNGPTRFYLKNGQIWETRSQRRYDYSATDPEVVITRHWPGLYRLRIVATGQAISVRRVE